MKRLVLKLIRFYQATLSPDHGWMKVRHPYGFCRYYPSCSEYAYLSVEKFGLFVGLWLGARRLLRCNPFTTPRVDKIH